MTNTIVVQDVIGKPIAVLDADGKQVEARLEAAVNANPTASVTLSLRGLQFVTSAFLNAALGTFLLRHADFADRLIVTEVPSQLVQNKIDEAYRLATDPIYRERTLTTWSAELAYA